MSNGVYIYTYNMYIYTYMYTLLIYVSISYYLYVHLSLALALTKKTFHGSGVREILASALRAAAGEIRVPLAPLRRFTLQLVESHLVQGILGGALQSAPSWVP